MAIVFILVRVLLMLASRRLNMVFNCLNVVLCVVLKMPAI